MTDRRVIGFVVVVLAASGAAAVSAAVQDAQTLIGDARRVLDRLDLDSVEVTVADTEVTLSGTVPTLWDKTRAIDEVLQIAGVETVASELTIPEVEDDEEIAQGVASAVQRYQYNTIWDYVEASVSQGVVRLRGSVTPDRDKPGELFERVARVEGVQDIVQEIQSQSNSRRDRDLRAIIAQRVRRHPTFSQYSILPDPPFRILVDEGIVTLVGFVRSPTEQRVLEEIARQPFEVVEVVNLLQVGG